MTKLRAVLGIDAAWTATQPSGVALVIETASGWELKAVEASYQCFYASSDSRFQRVARPSGSLPDAAALLHAAAVLSGRPVDLVAVDIPLAKSPILKRRVSDNEVSKAYGSRHCSTHTPSELRPGLISEKLRQSFANAGYGLQTKSVSSPGLIEVYPHPALVELTSSARRLPYKVGKSSTYWPGLSAVERRTKILDQWDEITTKLDGRIRRVRARLSRPAVTVRGAELKSCEDMLDAVVCAWVGICALEYRAQPFGDADSAIWIPDVSRRT
jgi:predicted RNase H-like nuclease